MRPHLIRQSKMTLNDQTRAYMLQMVGHYRAYKLSMKETLQLFQDLSDSGLLWELSKELQQYALNLARHELILLEFEGVGEMQ